jgi:hypothetical protein
MASRFPRPISLKSLLSVVAIVAGVPAQAAPPLACGTTLYASVTLTADVVCGSGQDGLVVGDHKVRIELNGFSIEGPYTFAQPTGPATGVVSSGFESVQIVGPGRITGFLRPVDIDGGNNHLISGVEIVAESGLPVSLRNASGSVIEASRITAVEIASDPGFRATANRVIGNDIGADPGLPGGGIRLSGCDTADNMVAYNGTRPGVWHTITLDAGANANQVLGNKIALGQVYLAGASNNMIAGNSIVNHGAPYAGVQIESSVVPVACAGGIVLPGSKNIVRRNRVYAGSFGVLIGDAGPALSSDNRVTGNTFSDQTYSGLIFSAAAANNDARVNTYINVPLIAYDFGVGNLWP